MLILDPPIDPPDPGMLGSGNWLGYVLAAVVGALGAGITAWATRRRDKASNEQHMIDQLQEQVGTLRHDLTVLQSEVRTLRVREIAWITHTSTLTQMVAQSGGAVPPLPPELRSEAPAATDT